MQSSSPLKTLPLMKKAIFKDPRLQEQFDTDGFVKVTLLENEDVAYLNTLCQSSFPDPTNHFFSSSYLNDFEKKMSMSNQIITIVEKRAKTVFENYRLIGAAFLIKGCGPNSEMPMHQDWTIVDESQYYAINVWIPLTHANANNGALEVIRGSHLWNKAVRAPTLPFYYDGYQEQLKEKLTMVEASPGEVIVLNQAIIHYSKPNNTNVPRPAITTGMVSQDAKLKLHYWNKEQPKQLEVFDQQDDFLLKFEDFHSSIFERPVLGKSAGILPYDLPNLSEKEFHRLTRRGGTKRKSLLQRLFKN